PAPRSSGRLSISGQHPNSLILNQAAAAAAAPPHLTPAYYQPHQPQGAAGFRLNSLLKLRDVRSLDTKSNLMNYLANMVAKTNPELLTLPADFANLTNLKHVKTKDVLDQILEHQKAMRRMRRFKEKLERNVEALIKVVKEEQKQEREEARRLRRRARIQMMERRMMKRKSASRTSILSTLEINPSAQEAASSTESEEEVREEMASVHGSDVEMGDDEDEDELDGDEDLDAEDDEDERHGGDDAGDSEADAELIASNEEIQNAKIVIEKVESFLDMAQHRFEELVDMVEVLDKSWKSTAIYFGEKTAEDVLAAAKEAEAAANSRTRVSSSDGEQPPKQTSPPPLPMVTRMLTGPRKPPEEIFEVIYDFMQHFREAHIQNEEISSRERRMAAQKIKRSGTPTPSLSREKRFSRPPLSQLFQTEIERPSSPAPQSAPVKNQNPIGSNRKEAMGPMSAGMFEMSEELLLSAISATRLRP
ncbi:hypothetical protein BGW38_008693, partial [Lunasporangiospora selenospora]